MGLRVRGQQSVGRKQPVFPESFPHQPQVLWIHGSIRVEKHAGRARAVQHYTRRKLVLQLDYHAFWLADTKDGWFRANATTQVRPVGTGSARRDIANNFTGQEVDFTAAYPLGKCLKILGGYSRFFAGPYLHDTGAAADADFVYLQTTLQF